VTESVPFHSECIGCLSRARQVDGETAMLILLSMLTYDDVPLEDLVRDLCFEHRRRVHEAVRLAEKEKQGA
jgi:hypothetical protein